MTMPPTHPFPKPVCFRTTFRTTTRRQGVNLQSVADEKKIAGGVTLDPIARGLDEEVGISPFFLRPDYFFFGGGSWDPCKIYQLMTFVYSIHLVFSLRNKLPGSCVVIRKLHVLVSKSWQVGIPYFLACHVGGGFTKSVTHFGCKLTKVPIRSMGLVYLPTWMVDFHGINVGIYTMFTSRGLRIHCF